MGCICTVCMGTQIVWFVGSVWIAKRLYLYNFYKYSNRLICTVRFGIKILGSVQSVLVHKSVQSVWVLQTFVLYNMVWIAKTVYLWSMYCYPNGSICTLCLDSQNAVSVQYVWERKLFDLYRVGWIAKRLYQYTLYKY